jgi:mRNA interferase YafQ
VLIATTSSRFKKDVKRLRGNNRLLAALDETINLLLLGEKLPERYKDHELTGNYAGFRECHVKPDLLLIYQVIERESTLYLLRTGSHSELFD